MSTKEIMKKILKIFPKIEYKIKYHIYKNNFKKSIYMSDDDKKNYLNIMYKKIFNCNIDWNNPRKLSEKIQYEKIYGKNDEIKALLTDKYKVRKWIKEKIGEEYLIPLIGIYNSFEEIDYNSLPNQFVIKCNHDSGSVTIVKDKSKVNWKNLRYKYNYHLKTDFSKFSLEKHYSLIIPKIIIEELVLCEDGDLPDYKFWCFNSKVYYCRVDISRYGNHKRNMYDLEWNLQEWVEGIYENKEDLERPNNFDEMVSIAKKLCIGFPEVRVDLYNANGKIYFGEMTFSSASGLEYIEPKYDLMLGNLWGEIN